MSRDLLLLIILLGVNTAALQAQDHWDRIGFLKTHDWTLQGPGGDYGYEEVQVIHFGDHSLDYTHRHFLVAGTSFTLTKYHAALALAAFPLLVGIVVIHGRNPHRPNNFAG